MIEVQHQHQVRGPARRRGARRPATHKQTPLKAFEFVESDPSGRAPSERRKFIRSHVMRGKNTTKRVARIYEGEDLSWLNTEPSHTRQSTPICSDSSPTPDPRPESYRSLSHVLVDHASNQSPQDYVFYPSSFLGPLRPPPDLCLFSFVEDVDDASRQLIRRFFVNIKETMYPAEWCFGFDLSKVCWFDWLFKDAAYFHSLLFTVSAFQDIITSPAFDATAGKNLSILFSRRTQVHLRRAMELLQERIQDRERQLEDVTAAVVVTMAMMSDAVGDVAACAAHVNGLKEMVRMRGGLKAFKHNRQLQIKICRIDLGWSISTGSKPGFFEGDISWSRFFDMIILKQCPVDNDIHRATIDSLIQNLDLRLVNVFADMRDFARTANVLITSKDKLRPELFQEIMLSIQYRLLLLEYPPDFQHLEEAVRIGLITFQTSIFLQIPGMKLKFQFLDDKLRTAIELVGTATPALVDLKLWLLFIGAIGLFDPDEPWLKAAITELTEEAEWAEVRERLKAVMWIDAVHDAPGKRIFEATRMTRDFGDKQPWLMGI